MHTPPDIQPPHASSTRLTLVVLAFMFLFLLLMGCSSEPDAIDNEALNAAAREGNTRLVRSIIKERSQGKGGRRYRNQVIEAERELTPEELNKKS